MNETQRVIDRIFEGSAVITLSSEKRMNDMMREMQEQGYKTKRELTIGNYAFRVTKIIGETL